MPLCPGPVSPINRLCDPGSGLAVEQHWYPSTALEDLLHIAWQDERHAVLSLSGPPAAAKTKVEQHLNRADVLTDSVSTTVWLRYPQKKITLRDSGRA